MLKCCIHRDDKSQGGVHCLCEHQFPAGRVSAGSESPCKVVPRVKVKNRYSEVALVVSEARLLSPRRLLVLVLTCLPSAQEEPSACSLFEVQCNR